MKKLLVPAVAALLCGCVGNFTMVAPAPPASYTKLGHAHGESCGALMVLATAYNFIPVQLTERTANAYSNAVASVPGATGLVDVTIHEHWFWWVLGSSRCTVIEGEAIK
jgi:hypothetical protein